MLFNEKSFSFVNFTENENFQQKDGHQKFNGVVFS